VKEDRIGVRPQEFIEGYPLHRRGFRTRFIRPFTNTVSYSSRRFRFASFSAGLSFRFFLPIAPCSQGAHGGATMFP
jgi:hypothetical protein